MLPQTENSQQIDGRKAPRNAGVARRFAETVAGRRDRADRGRRTLDIWHLVPSKGAHRAKHGDSSSGPDGGVGGVAKTNYSR